MTLRREIYVKQRSLVSNMISKAKKDYLCHRIVNYGSFLELVRLSTQMIVKFGDTMLFSKISPESLPDKFNEIVVHKTEEIRSYFQPDRPISNNLVEFSGTLFEQCQLVTEILMKTVVQNAPKSRDFDHMPTPVLCECLDEIIPTVTSIINKSLPSGIVPQCLNMLLSNLC